MDKGKILTYFIFVLAGAIAFSFYTSLMVSPVSAAEKHTLVFWHAKSGHRGKVWAKMVDEFNKTHPDIQVTATYQGGYTVTLQKITTAIAAGATPDASEIPNRYGIPQFAESRKLLALDQFISKQDKADFFQGGLQRGIYKDKLYALPNAVSNSLLFYNADMFREVGLDPDKPPKTWEELISYAKKLTRDIDGDGKIDKWGLGTHTTTNYFLYALILQNGGKLFDSVGNPAFTSQEAVEACQFWSDLVHKYKVMPPLTHKATNKLFAAGTTAMMYQSTGFLAKIGKQIGDRFEVRVVFLPKNKQYGTGLGGTSIGIFKSNPKREAATWEFVKWVTNTKWGAYWSENTGYVATRKSSNELASHKNFLEAHPRYKVAEEQMKYALIMPATKGDGIIYKPFSKLAEKLEADPDADIKKALDEIAELVRKGAK
jgi:sn-glycerol 3-phosphate transport system substrate-binding protein